MKRIKKLRARTEKYKDRQTGQEKQGYATMGYLLAKEDGTEMVKIDSIPVGFDGWIYFGDLDSKPAQQAAQPSQYASPQPESDFDDDIPF